METPWANVSLFPGLFAGIEVAFEHQAHDGVAAVAELAEDFTCDQPWRR